MTEFYYRDYGLAFEVGAEDDEIQARLRLDHMRRALREASGANIRPEKKTRPAPGISGEVLDDADRGGDGARVIDGESSASAWGDVRLKPETLRRSRRR